jgi:hypothetical protein
VNAPITSLHRAGRPRNNRAKTEPPVNLTGLLGEDTLIKPENAAATLGFSPHTLEKWYALGEGPRPVLISGKRAGYRIGELRRWVREHERGSSAT